MAQQAVHSTVDFEAIKAKQRAIWSSGDYGTVATTIQFMSEVMCEQMDLRAGMRVLDVATGSGNAAIAAARRGAVATGLDYATVLLDRARARSAADELDITWVEGDAESMPFPDDAFDAVTSVVGVMFAPDQPRAAAELVRCCRPGGTIAVSSWTPDGFIGELLRLVGSFVAPPAGLVSPTRWGTREGFSDLLGPDHDLAFIDRAHAFRFRSGAEFADFFIANYGPTERAHASLDREGQAAFRQAVAALADARNIAVDGTLVVPGAYLEVQARVS